MEKRKVSERVNQSRSGPKDRDMIAQGEALGVRVRRKVKP